ncbi:MAG TPA: hypothetical protein VK843_15620 [Planctomycetota bacterium]|nr:hypothetical protein [Planctomycetota bacterium]
MKDNERAEELPSWLWLWFPPLIIVAQMLARARSEEFYVRWMRSEFGIVEQGTVLFLVIALASAILLLVRKPLARPPGYAVWMFLMALGCLYFGGEEASWGQHYFGWKTPEVWAAVNEQQETNLHNLGGIGDQAPRLVLTLGVLFGGVLLPLWFRGRGRDSALLRHPLAWTIPTIVVLPSALIATLVTLPKGIFRTFHQPVPYLVDFQAGETKEYAFGLFLMLYMLSMWRRRERLQDMGSSHASAVAVDGSVRATN